MLHSGPAGCQADAVHEAGVLHSLAGVPGVVRCRELIMTSDDAIHMVLEYAPLLLNVQVL